MSVLQKALTEVGMSLEGDKLPKDQRTQKCFQRVIAAIRAAEAEVMDRLSQAERELNEALRVDMQLQERVRVLEAENLQHRLKARLGEIESLTTADRTQLLALSAPNGSAVA
jgi:arginine utilization protein RocB